MILGIDIGGTRIKTGFIDNEKLSHKNNFPTPKNLDEFRAQIKEIIRDYLNINSFTKIAFSVPGSVNESGTVLYGGAVAYLNSVNLKELINSWGAENDWEVSVENDAKAATLGEMALGNLRQVKNGAALILGTGVGMGICINGQLYKGSHNQSGEISFWIRERTIYNSDTFLGIGLSAVKLITLLAECLEIENDGPKVFKALQETKNKKAEQLFTSYCEEMAIVCFNLQTILDLDKIVIGGGISQQALFITKIQEAYQKLFMTAPVIQKTLQPILIEATKFKADANLIGAAKGGFNDK